VEPDRTVRLGPLPEEEWDDQTRAALAALLPPERRNPRGAGNALATTRAPGWPARSARAG
jgi:4-carboxymuconolactone decarboxylase